MPSHDSLFASLEEWIEREAISFSLETTGSLNAAIDQVVSSLGDCVELLGLGEPTHGAEEFLTLRNRVFQRLVERHGYTAIAVESSFPRGQVVDDYVNGLGDDQSFDDIAQTGFSHGFGAYAANRELIEWMRSYNTDASNDFKLRFYGFDSPTEMMWTDSPRQLLDFALNYFASHDAEAGQVHRDRIHKLLGDDAAWETQEAAMDPTKSIGLSPAAISLRIATEDLAIKLATRRPELVANGGTEAYAAATHHLSAARQLLVYHAAIAATDKTSQQRLSDCLAIRDAMMAENLAYIVERERCRGPVFAFAHNSHLKVGRTEWQWGPQLLAWWPAGSHIRTMLGERYAVIGVGVAESQKIGLGVPEPGTLEALLNPAPDSGCFVKTPGDCLPSTASEQILTRPISNAGYFPFTRQSLTDFDYLALLNSIA